MSDVKGYVVAIATESDTILTTFHKAMTILSLHLLESVEPLGCRKTILIKTKDATNGSVAQKDDYPGRAYFIRHGESTSYVTDYLFATLDSDKSGTVDMQELEDYVSTYGLVANLNVISATASPATT